jgi:signal peptidase II
MNRRNIVFLVFTLLGLLTDQASKAWIVANINAHTGAIDVIPGFFQLVHAQNPGAAIGMLRDNPYRFQLFMGFTVIASLVILDLFRRLPKDDWFMATTLGLIFSGALGNAVDRVFNEGHRVTDFLRFYSDSPSVVGWLRGYGLPNEYPSFNLADSWLVIGVGMFMLHYMFLEEKEPDVTPTETPAG